jgi:PAS domain S-box-containing protein
MIRASSTRSEADVHASRMRDLIADALLHDSEEAFCVLDRDWRFVYLSTHAVVLARRPREELLGKCVWEEFPEAVGTTGYEELHRAVTQSVPVAYEEYFPPLGTWFEVHAYPKHDFLVVHVRDVTHRRRAQAALHESEERFQLVASATGDVIWDHDFRTERLWWSENFTRLFGYLPEAVGSTFASWEERVHPEDRARVSNSIEEALRTRLPTRSAEYRFRCADGKYVHVLDRMQFLYDEEGNPRRAVGLLTDITEQKAAEERQRFLYQTGLVLTSTLDYRQRLRDLARACAGPLADYCIVDVLEGDGDVRRIEAAAADPEQEQLVRELLRFPPVRTREEGVPKTLEMGEPVLVERVTDKAMQRMAQSAEHLDVLRALAPLTYVSLPLRAHGETLGAFTLANTTPGRRFAPADVALAEDLARQAALGLANARLHRDAEHARQTAEKASHAKGQFLAMMSHELRTPLNAIVTFADLIETEVSGPATPMQKEHVARIKASAWHLVGMIDEVLTFSRTEAGAEQVHLDAVDAAEIGREVIHLLMPKADAKGIALHHRLPEHPVEIEADERKLRQILMNLLGNAIKFTQQGEVVFEVEQTEKWTWFRVCDTGEGIAPEDQERIFEPFVQAEDGHTRRYDGSGLGLAISRRFARMLGGDIEVESAPGRGSTFMLQLPTRAAG